MTCNWEIYLGPRPRIIDGTIDAHTDREMDGYTHDNIPSAIYGHGVKTVGDLIWSVLIENDWSNQLAEYWDTSIFHSQLFAKLCVHICLNCFMKFAMP